MKTKIMVTLIACTLLLAATPSFSYAGHHHGGGAYIAAPLIGGLLAGAIIGSALSQPRYVAPQPVYAYQPTRIYAPPPPAVPYGPAYVEAPPPGQWVIVPERWVNGRWVPAHRAWVPVNPY
jgi:hypothetical protein